MRALIAWTIAVMILTTGMAQASEDPSIADRFKGYVYDEKGRYLTWWGCTEDATLDSHGIPLVQTPVGMRYNPATVATYGLRCFSTYIVRGDQDKRAVALRLADWLVRTQDKRGRWTYGFDHPIGPGRVIDAPWPSALAQGMGISLLTRVYRDTGKPAYLLAARRALAPFQVAATRGGVRVSFLGGPFYEEAPFLHRTMALAGFMFSLVGLYDLARTDPRSEAGRLYRDGIGTLERVLPYYDAGPTQLYWLLHLFQGNDPRVGARALPKISHYREMHVILLYALHSVSPSRELRFWRDDFVRDYDGKSE